MWHFSAVQHFPLDGLVYRLSFTSDCFDIRSHLTCILCSCYGVIQNLDSSVAMVLVGSEITQNISYVHSPKNVSLKDNHFSLLSTSVDSPIWLWYEREFLVFSENYGFISSAFSSIHLVLMRAQSRTWAIFELRTLLKVYYKCP